MLRSFSGAAPAPAPSHGGGKFIPIFLRELCKQTLWGNLVIIRKMRQFSATLCNAYVALFIATCLKNKRKNKKNP